MPEQNPIPTRIITVYKDGSIFVQELHQATSTEIPDAGPMDDPQDPIGGDGGGNNPPPPKDP